MISLLWAYFLYQQMWIQQHRGCMLANSFKLTKEKYNIWPTATAHSICITVSLGIT